MFGSSMDYTARNEMGEYEVAQGISASVFKSILVSVSDVVIWNASPCKN